MGEFCGSIYQKPRAHLNAYVVSVPADEPSDTDLQQRTTHQARLKNCDTVSAMKDLKSAVEKSDKILSPYSKTALQEFSREIPEKKKLLEIVLKEMNEQAVSNFGVFESEAFRSTESSGVSFSFTKVSVTPELIRKLSRAQSSAQTEAEAPEDPLEQDIVVRKEENLQAKRHDYFLFPAFAPPPEAHAFGAEDVAIDRLLRLLPRVANAIRNGEEPPEVNMYMLGTPTGFGGSVNSEWIQNIEQEGMEPFGKLYAEFVRQHEKENENTHIVLQGVSRGAMLAEKTSKQLPKELQEITQRLLDNPAGEHARGHVTTWLKGTQVASGLFGEGTVRMLFNTKIRDLRRRGESFIDYLSKKTGVPRDDAKSLALKRKATYAEGLALLKGANLDTDLTRLFIRRGIYDPQTFSLKRLVEIQQKRDTGTPVPFFKNGKSLEAGFKGYHFFVYNRYKRWAQILDFVENTKM